MNEGAKKHFLLTIARANQSTSVIRAVVFSTNTHHILYRHLYGIVYTALAVDLGKLFDKSYLSLERFIKMHKEKMKQIEYDDVIKKLAGIKEKHQKVIKSIESVRHKMGAHLNEKEANRIYNDPYTEVNVLQVHDVKMLLDDIIALLNSLSVLDDEDRTILKERIGPKDVMDIMGLEMDREVAKELLEKIQNNQ